MLVTGVFDILSMIRSYTRPSRFWNACKVYASYQLSRLFGKPIQWGFPISLSIEPTTACNLRCPQCPSGLRQFSRATGRIQEDDFTHIVNEVKKHAGYLTFYFQGEPYIHARFTEMVKYAARQGMYTATSTNAHFLDEGNARKTVACGLSRLIISIDGSTQETYGKYRLEGSLEKVLEGTRNLVEARKEAGSRHPYIIWQFIVFAHNEHQLPEMHKLAKEYGVDKLAVKTAQIYDYEDAEDWLPKDKSLSRYSRGENGVQMQTEWPNRCWRLWNSCVITWDGNVVPCCFDKDAKHNLGNVADVKFKDIWNGEAYRNFRKSLIAGRKNIDICRNCSEGTKVWV
ncbi:MAG: SPASM domain-containing protein [Bacteroidetes bacterium]|nr:SPASM domain-containing protein [Bacteroidota bacterium]